MMNMIESAKQDFIHALAKGKILPLKNLLPSDDVNAYSLLKSWYHHLTGFSFLPEFLDDLQEIIIHSPLDISYVYLRRTIEHDCDLTQTDISILAEIIAIRYQIEWTPLNPCVSFHGTLRGRPVRYTLIHGSTNIHNQVKIFIRFLNDTIFSLDNFGNYSTHLLKMVSTKKNILVSGATRSGKTTLLNSLLNQIDSSEHIVIVEDTHEILFPRAKGTRFLAKQDMPQQSQLQFLKHALRISPDRIVLGEIRSREVEALLLAMNSGHNGVMSTIHANDGQDAIQKLALLIQLYSPNQLDYAVALKLIAHNIDYVVQLKNKEISEITEVYGADENQVFFDIL